MDPVMAHLFVVDHKFLKDWKNFYTCQADIVEINEEDLEGSYSLKLKSSVNQQDEDDDDE